MHRFGIIRCDNSWPVLAAKTDMRSYGDRMGELMDAWGWYEIYMSEFDIDDEKFDMRAIFSKDGIEPDELLLFAKQVQRAFARGMKPRRKCKIIAKAVNEKQTYPVPALSALDLMMDDIPSSGLVMG